MNISSISMFSVKPINFAARRINSTVDCPKAKDDMVSHYERLNGRGGKNPNLDSGIYDDNGNSVIPDDYGELNYPDNDEPFEYIG